MVLNDAGVIGLSLDGKSFPATAPVVARARDWIHVVNDDPNASVPGTILFVVAAGLSAWFAMWTFRRRSTGKNRWT